MNKMIYATVKKGMNTLVRVAGVLKRKNFYINNLKMEAVDEKYSKLIIELEEQDDLGVKQAIQYMKKLDDVYEVVEFKS